MKVMNGFLLAYDEALKRMVPFFVKVRSRDIVPDDPVEIGAALTPTSMRWDLVRVDNNTDVTVYTYRPQAGWSTHDPNNETVYTDSLTGELQYKLYKDGRMTMSADLRAKGSGTSGAAGVSYSYELPLPFAFNEDNPTIKASWGYGNTPAFTAASINKDAISNAAYNPEFKTDTYGFVLHYWMLIPSQFASDFDNFRTSFDPNTSTTETIDEYMESNFPVHIEYNGWWRPEKPSEVTDAEFYDGNIAGTYRTIGMVNLLSSPDPVNGGIVRSIAAKTEVKSNGYFSTVNGEDWYLMVYVPTNDCGYIPASMLTKL